MLTQKQQGVLRGMLAGVVITLLALLFSILSPPAAMLPEPGVAAAFAQALMWDVLLVATLALNIALLARHRFFTPEDIDGGGLTEGTPRAHVLQSTLQNTLEQVVLAFCVHLIWAGTMPQAWQVAIPAAAMLFVVGRILFWRGYARGAAARALGFGLTFYPTVAMLLAIGARLAWE
jgi:hypothetical protein